MQEVLRAVDDEVGQSFLLHCHSLEHAASSFVNNLLLQNLLADQLVTALRHDHHGNRKEAQ